MFVHSTLAYVGPGPGLTMFWAFLGLLGTICLAFFSLLLWPIRLVMRKFRGEPPADAPGDAPAAPPTTPDSTQPH